MAKRRMSGRRCARLTTFSHSFFARIIRRESNEGKELSRWEKEEDERVSVTKTVEAIEPNREKEYDF